LWTHCHQYFGEGEYILVNKGIYSVIYDVSIISDKFLGYPSSPFVMWPFDEREVGQASAADKPQIRAFNQRLSNI
jgi:hypothetical protein